MGTSDAIPGSGSALVLGSGSFDDGSGILREYPTITYQRNLETDDVIYEIETSTTLAAGNWHSAAGVTVLVSSINHGDGTATAGTRMNSIVCNAGPLIALSGIGQAGLLFDLLA